MAACTRVLYPSVDYVVDGEASLSGQAYSTQRWQKDPGSSMVAPEIASEGGHRSTYRAYSLQ
jgi:hypothetical protein